MPVNKVDLSTGETLIDLTGDSVTPETLAQGETAHDATGASIVGTMTAGTAFTLTATTTPGATVTATLGDLVVTAVADASGTAVLTLPEAGTWTVVSTYNGQTVGTRTVDLSYQYDVTFADPILNNNDWGVIGTVSNAEEGENYWSIGDGKETPLNGTVGQLTLTNYICYAFILGFNHNAALEGRGRIHFGLAKTALSGGKDVAFIDSKLNSSVSQTGYFSMNASNTNSGGWASSQMRTNICGTSISSYSGTIIAVIPAALRAVLKSVTKYTDNTGNSSAASAVTATTDYFFLLSEYEVFGSISYGNSNESSKQKQYAYYSAGNSVIRYRYNSQSSDVVWWLRTPVAAAANQFVRERDGVSNAYSAYVSNGFAPCFCV